MIRVLKWFEDSGNLIAIFYFKNGRLFHCLDPNDILKMVCGDLIEVFLDGNKLMLKYNMGEFHFDLDEKNILINPIQITPMPISTFDFSVFKI